MDNTDTDTDNETRARDKEKNFEGTNRERERTINKKERNINKTIKQNKSYTTDQEESLSKEEYSWCSDRNCSMLCSKRAFSVSSRVLTQLSVSTKLSLAPGPETDRRLSCSRKCSLSFNNT